MADNYSRSRITWIDTAKGIGVLLVVLGHMPSIPEVIRLWIFSFHMPLFFFVSGFCYNDSSTARPFLTTVIYKTKKMLLPYCIYSAFFILFDFLFLGEGLDGVTYSFIRFLRGQGGFDVLWFFVTLFLVETIYVALRKICRQYTTSVIILLAVVGLICAQIRIGLIYKLPTVFVALLIYDVGARIRTSSLKLPNEVPQQIIAFIVAGVINVLCSVVCIKVSGVVVDMNTYRYALPPLSLVAAFSGIVCVLIFSQWIDNIRLTRILTYIGENSIFFYPLTCCIPVFLADLFELHGFNVGFGVKIVFKVIGFAAAGLVAYLFSYTRRKRSVESK